MAIKEEFVTIKCSGNNLSYFKNLGYVCIFGEFFRVKVVDLLPGSTTLITRICDKCYSEQSVRYSNYKNLCKKCTIENKKTDAKYKKRKSHPVDFSQVVNDGVFTKWSNYTKSYYVNLGYVFTGPGNEFFVSIKDVHKNSHATIEVICKSCKKNRIIEFRNYAPDCKACASAKLWDIPEHREKQARAVSAASKKRHEENRKNGVYGWKMKDGRKIYRAKRSSHDEIEWSKAVKIRDRYACQLCLRKNIKLNSHHLMSYTFYPETRFDLDNGICLCVECHMKFHSKYGKKTNKKQFEEFSFYARLNNIISIDSYKK